MAYKFGAACLWAAGVMMVSGCTTPAVKTQDVVPVDIASIRASGVQPMVGIDVPLRKRTKGKVLAARSVQVVAALLGGGQITPWHSQILPADGYTVTEGHAMALKPGQLAILGGPADALARALRATLISDGIPVVGQAPYSIKIKANYWGLDYDKFSEANDYRLYYSVQVDLMDGKRMMATYACDGVTDDKRGVDAWTAHDDAEVKRDAAIIGDICAGKAWAAFNVAPPMARTVAAEVRR